MREIHTNLDFRDILYDSAICKGKSTFEKSEQKIFFTSLNWIVIVVVGEEDQGLELLQAHRVVK